MGFLSELKKLFWASSSVAKSAADKGLDRMKDVGEDVLEKSAGMGEALKDRASDLGEDILERSAEMGATLKDKATDLGGDILDKSSEFGSSLKDRAGDLGGDLAAKTGGLRDAILHSAEGTMSMVNKSETLKKAASATERIGEQVLSKGEALMNKGEDAVEALGSKILGENHENLEKLKNFTEDLGSKVNKAKDNIVEIAGEALEDIEEKIDDTLAKGKLQDAKEAANPTPDLQEILDDNKGSLLDDKDDFFSKAAAYAEGDYHGAQEGKVTIEKAQDIVKKAPAVAAGFTDHDGDGNEMVDDAIIEVEDTVSSVVANVTEQVDDVTQAVVSSEEE